MGTGAGLRWRLCGIRALHHGGYAGRGAHCVDGRRSRHLRVACEGLEKILILAAGVGTCQANQAAVSEGISSLINLTLRHSS
jgi:hypothetical protein